MRKISEVKKVSGKQIITILSLLVSMIGGIFTLLYGVTGFTTGAYWEQSYFYALIALAALTIFGDILGFLKKAVGIGVSFVIGIIGFIYTIILGAGNYDLGLIIPILLILIGGIVGLSANYENLKDWMEKRRKEGGKLRGEKKREVKWEKKLWIPGVFLLILGVIYIYVEVALCPITGVLCAPGGIPLGIVFMIVGPLLIIYSVIKLRRKG